MKGVSDEIRERYSQFLTSLEKITSIFYFGIVTILLTDQRVIILKGFPRSITSFRTRDVEFAGFVTRIKWFRLVIGLFLSAISHFFNTWASSFFVSIFGLKSVYYMLGVIFAFGGLIFLIQFISSLFGRFEIHLEYDPTPIRICIPYSENSIGLINHIEKTR